MVNMKINKIMNRKYDNITPKIQYKLLKSGRKIEYIEYLIAEDKVLKTFENQLNQNSNRLIIKEEVLTVLSSSFRYPKQMSNDIIDTMIEDNLIEYDGEFLTLNLFFKFVDNLWILDTKQNKTG